MTVQIVLQNPKNAHNVGGALRAASCFGADGLWFTGTRVSTEVPGGRLPREERMKQYQDVLLQHGEYPFDAYPEVTPVCVEVDETAEQLVDFEHPENAMYVFGPEDGHISSVYRRHCHRFVMIPTRHCTNLSAAVYLVLYDRHAKRVLAGDEPRVATRDLLAEPRGWADHEEIRP